MYIKSKGNIQNIMTVQNMNTNENDFIIMIKTYMPIKYEERKFKYNISTKRKSTIKYIILRFKALHKEN